MRRKATKQSRGPNAAEKAFQGWLAEQPCCVCEREPVQVHHCLGSSYKHDKVLIGHWFCIPLCVMCHEFYHKHKHTFSIHHGRQSFMWDDLVIRKHGISEKVVPDEVWQAILNTRK